MGHLFGTGDVRIERRLVPRGLRAAGGFRVPGSPACLVSMQGGAAETAVRSALAAAGFRARPLPAAPAEAEGDLCVLDAPRLDEAAARRIAALRSRSALRNPFAGVLVVGDAPTAEAVQAVARAGADLLLAPPISAADVGGRVRRLAESDREFVVTADYVGPDRRRSPRTDPSDAPRLRVPNALAMRIAGSGPEEIQAAIDDAWTEVGRTQAAACAFAVGFAVQRAAAAAERFDFDVCSAVAEVPERLRALRACAGALAGEGRRDRVEVFARQLEEMAVDGAEDLQKLMRDLPRAVRLAADLLVVVRGVGDRTGAEAELCAAAGRRAPGG